MDLEEQKPGTSHTEGTARLNGERNLATRRHTVGPSETAHNQVVGRHFKLGQRGNFSFYPPGGLVPGYSPLALPTQMTSNPLTGLNHLSQTPQGFFPGFDPTGRAHAALPGSVNSHLSITGGHEAPCIGKKMFKKQSKAFLLSAVCRLSRFIFNATTCSTPPYQPPTDVTATSQPTPSQF